MAKAVATGGNHPLLVLLSCLGSTLLADAASLCYSFTVGKSGSGPWWHQVQGQLNKETFICCGSTNNCHAIGLLGNKLIVTKTWEPQVDTLKDAVDQLKAEVVTMREPLTLKVRMCCWHEVDGLFIGSWNIGLNGHKILHVQPSTGKGAEVDHESRWTKEMKKNRDLTAFLNKTSQGDCKTWLEEFKLHWEEKVEPTGLVKDSTCVSTSDSPTATPAVDQASSMAIKPNAYVLLIMFTCSLLLLI